MLSLVTLVGVSCSEKEEDGGSKKGKSGYAKLALRNDTARSLERFDYVAATQFGVKILSAIISPDEEGAQSAAASLIWANPDCEIETVETEIDDVKYEYQSASECQDDEVSTFVDLALGTTAVNDELNSQNRKVLPGTYNYVQLVLCNSGPSGPNIQFMGGDMTTAFEATGGTCGVSSVQATEPIVIGEGDTVTVGLAYDLAESVYLNGGGTANDLCSTTHCTSGVPALTPYFVE
jgi:hypothetical protein